MKYFILLISIGLVYGSEASEMLFTSGSLKNLYISPQSRPIVVSEKEIIFRHKKKLLTFPVAKTKKWEKGHFLVRATTWEKQAKEKLDFNACRVKEEESSKFRQGSTIYYFQGPRMECGEFFIPEIKNIQAVIYNKKTKKCQTFTKGE